MQSNPVRIGTRGSPLALAQAHEVRDRLTAALGADAPPIEIVVIKTTGDRILDRPLSEAGGKGLFTKEIEEALIDGSVDLAVHSSKDMPTRLPEGLVMDHFLPREDVRDVFIGRGGVRFHDLAPGAVVGTASLRRQALVKRLRPDLSVVTYRGNVQSRLRKLEAGEVDGTLLALAGLNRLGLFGVATEVLSAHDFPRRWARGRSGSRSGTVTGARPISSPASTIRTRRSASAPSGPFSPRSTAPAGRRSPVMPCSPAARCRSTA